MAVTLEQHKAYVLKLIKDLRSPDKQGFATVLKVAEQQKREYETAKAKAAKTGLAKDIAFAKRLKEIVAYNDSIAESRKLTNEAQTLYENIDANRKKLDSLKGLGEGKTEEAKKIQRQLERARASLKTIEVKRDKFGPNPKGPSEPPVTPKPKPTPKPVKVEKTTPVPTPVSKSTAKTIVTPKEKEKTDAEREAEALNIAAGQDFTLPKTLFDNIPSLKLLLEKYVDKKWTPDRLRKELRDDLWFKQNSAEIKARYVQYYNYQDLLKSGRNQGSTDYELQIAKIEANLKKRATEIGSAAASDPAALRKAAENLYITNRSEDDTFVDSFLAASIQTTSGMIGGKVTEGYSGQALSNYKLLVKAARDNGFQMSDIIPGGASEQQVLQGIAAGTIDINRIIADSRKLAAQGQPQYVRDLLAQGYNLNQVYAPYRQTMANILEIGDADQIDLNDPTLRAAITDKGDMNVYDFKKLLRRDDRWQYTEQAKQDVSTAALDVLRDFGFQG